MIWHMCGLGVRTTWKQREAEVIKSSV